MLEKVVSKALSTVETVGETVINPAETAASEALKAGENLVEGNLKAAVRLPLESIEPFTVATGVAPGLIGTLEGKLSDVLKTPFTDFSNLLGNTSGGNDISGGSVEAILFQLAARERGRLTDKVFALKNLQAPGDGATPQQVKDYDTQKSALEADIQSLQNTVQQITTMATNIQKSDNDTNMSIVRNMA